VIQQGLTIETVWFDEHMRQFRFDAANESFSGTSHCYVSLDEAKLLAEHLVGFPCNTNDVREYQFGDPSGLGMGGAHLSFKCVDNLGHLAVAVKIWSDPSDNEAQSVSLVLRAVPAQIDSFVAELFVMDDEERNKASLNHAT
jgi:hypothetical protein